MLERINKLAGLPAEQDCDLIEFVMLREYSPVDRQQIIELALAERPDVGLVIIDGLRDLLFDINSSTEAGEVIGLHTYVASLAMALPCQCAIARLDALVDC